jgi:hypothetical protein
MAKLVIKGKGLRDEVLKLKEGANRLGRSAANDFVILDTTVSRFHCEIEVGVDAMFVRDLDSANGTYVNDLPVMERAELHNGEILRLGDVCLEVREAPEPVDESKVPMCAIHPTYPANMECSQCHKVFCGSCVHILRRSGGKILRLCPQCSGHCVPLGALRAGPKGFLQDIVGKLLKKRTVVRHPFQD